MLKIVFWRDLCVRCFKFLFLIFISLQVYADTYLVMPTNAVTAEVGVGDILEVEVINQDGSKVNLKDNRLGKIFYILENIEENTYRVVVSPKKSADKDNVEKDSFEYRGFKFNQDLKNFTNEYVTKEIELDLEKTGVSYIRYIIFSLIMIVFIWFGPELYKKYHHKKKVNQRKKYLIKKINTIKTRNDIEEIYKYKKEWRDLFDISSDSYNQIVQILNTIQYKKSWDDEDRTIANKAIKKLRGLIGGI